MVSVLFVCLGNICRSPTAEGVMAALLEAEGLGDRIAIDSAGTGAWHAGEAPDRRSTAAARRRGVQLAGQARRVRSADFHEFDHIVAMDGQNLADLRAMARGLDGGAQISLFRDFVEGGERDLDVPDPYYGGANGFETVLDICDAGCRGLLAHLRTTCGV